MELFNNYKNYAEVSRLRLHWKQQREMASIEELREGMVSQDFEWQNLATGIVQLRAKTEVDIEDLEYSERRMASFRDEIARKFPNEAAILTGSMKGRQRRFKMKWGSRRSRR